MFVYYSSLSSHLNKCLFITCVSLTFILIHVVNVKTTFRLLTTDQVIQKPAQKWHFQLDIVYIISRIRGHCSQHLIDSRTFFRICDRFVVIDDNIGLFRDRFEKVDVLVGGYGVCVSCKGVAMVLCKWVRFGGGFDVALCSWVRCSVV